MDQPVSIGQLVAVGSFLFLVGSGFAGWVWANLRGKANAPSVARLWESHNASVKDAADFKLTAAEKYVTGPQLAEMRRDLFQHMDRQFAEVQKSIDSLRSDLRDERRDRAHPAE